MAAIYVTIVKIWCRVRHQEKLWMQSLLYLLLFQYEVERRTWSILDCSLTRTTSLLVVGYILLCADECSGQWKVPKKVLLMEKWRKSRRWVSGHADQWLGRPVHAYHVDLKCWPHYIIQNSCFLSASELSLYMACWVWPDLQSVHAITSSSANAEAFCVQHAGNATNTPSSCAIGHLHMTEPVHV